MRSKSQMTTDTQCRATKFHCPQQLAGNQSCVSRENSASNFQNQVGGDGILYSRNYNLVYDLNFKTQFANEYIDRKKTSSQVVSKRIPVMLQSSKIGSKKSTIQTLKQQMHEDQNVARFDSLFESKWTTFVHNSNPKPEKTALTQPCAFRVNKICFPVEEKKGVDKCIHQTSISFTHSDLHLDAKQDITLNQNTPENSQSVFGDVRNTLKVSNDYFNNDRLRESETSLRPPAKNESPFFKDFSASHIICRGPNRLPSASSSADCEMNKRKRVNDKQKLMQHSILPPVRTEVQFQCSKDTAEDTASRKLSESSHQIETMKKNDAFNFNQNNKTSCTGTKLTLHTRTTIRRTHRPSEPVTGTDTLKFGLNDTEPLPSAVSQEDAQNISSYLRNSWKSESNTRQKCSQNVPANTYSAHRENLRDRPGLAKQSEQQRSTRQLEAGIGKIPQETIAFQPIGRGIYDLESTNATATLPRSWATKTGRSHCRW